MDFIDTYSIKARLFPSILAIAPVLVLCLLSATWVDPGIPEVVATMAVMVLFFAAANLARKLGRAKEAKIFADSGGRPFNPELTRSDSTLPAEQKNRYREFIALQLGVSAPTEADERLNIDKTRDFYNQAYTFLRESTRDQEKFNLLFNENISYGYHRNLLGLKAVGIALNLASLCIGAALIWLQPPFVEISTGKFIALCCLSALHLLYFSLAVNERAVLDASKTYARQLVLSTEVLMKSN